VKKKKMSLESIEQAVAILGEHFRNYVVIASDEDEPLAYDIRFSDPYAASGLLRAASKYHENYIGDGGVEEDWEWDECDDDDIFDDLDEY